MSGTSADGVDVALTEISGRGVTLKVKLLSFRTFPFDGKIKKRLLELGRARTGEICEMNFILGEIFAACVLKFLKTHDLAPQNIDFLGSHGQTIYHCSGDSLRKNSTLQIGEGAVMAGRTGILTVCDFRPADIVHGGTGAPLVPYADFVLFRKKGKTRALVNIGGIANVTVVPDRLNEVIAFDTGPGNMILDALVRLQSRGRKSWDSEGAIAGQGKVRRALIDEWMDMPYFSQRPPKSTGRETFGQDFSRDVWMKNRAAPFSDLMATATYFTAATIHHGFRDFIFPRFRVDEIYVSGGGLHNRTLMQDLRNHFSPISIHPLDVLGINGDAKEALAFALLADATLRGVPSNVPGATGAQRPAVLGKIIF